MASKNNPENRGQQTKPRTYNGKKVKPVLYINGPTRYMAAQYEDGTLAVNPTSNKPIAYRDATKGE